MLHLRKLLLVGLILTVSVDADMDFNCIIGLIESVEGANSTEAIFLGSNNSCSYHKSWRDVQWFESDHSFAPHQRIHISCKGNGNVEIYSEYHDTLEIVAKCSSPFPVDVEMDPKIAFRTTFFKTVRDKTNITHEVQIEGTDFNSCSKTCKNTTSFVFYSTVEPSLNFTIQLKLIRSIPDQINTNSCNDVEDLSLYISNGKAICESSVRSELELVNYITNNPLTTKMLHSCMLEHQNCRFPMSLEIRMTCNPPGKKENCIERKLSGHGLIHCSSQGRHKLLEYFTPLDRKAEGNMSLSLDTRNVIFLMKFSGWPIKPAQKEGISGFGTFFDTAAQTFNCDVVKYILILPVIWSVAFSNGTEIALNTGLPRRSLYLTIQMQFGMTAIKCSAGYWNSDEVATAVYNLNVKRRNESIPPTFIHKETTHFVELGSSVELNCTVDEADPLPLYDWKLLNSKLSIFEVTNRINKAVLVISAFNSFMAGDFVCNATNFLGESAIRTFKVRSPPVPTSKLWIYLSTAFGVIVILCGIIASLSWCYYLQRGRLSDMEIKLFENGNRSGSAVPHEFAQHMPYNRDFEIDWDDFQIGDEKLGEGAFGVVFKGNLLETNQTVAIKTVRAGVEKAIILALLAELKTLIYLGKHENIIQIIGACTEFLRHGQVYVMVEYCAGGSLDSFLRKNADTFQSNRPTAIEVSQNTTPEIYSFGDYELPFNITNLMNWSVQIAHGMNYLESKKVIHGDLATRNVLLSSNDQIKITDFGLSRQLLSAETYTKKTQENFNNLPWRWLALETLKSLDYSSKTDVWSFGVTLWEIFTLGQIPYAGMTWSDEFLQYLEDDLRLSPPKHATDAIYKLMRQCWIAEPKKRPSFQELEEILLQINT